MPQKGVFFNKSRIGVDRAVGEGRVSVYTEGHMSIEITSADFARGVTGDDYMIGDGRSQVAFLGRSNVGKSSVINSLVNRHGLAHSSSTPGKTKQANFYLINDTFYIVDFPGYGYAKISQKERDRIAKRILWYIQYSPVRPKVVLLVVDAQVGLTEQDEEMIRILKDHNHEIIVIANKADKLKQGEMIKAVAKIKEKTGPMDIFLYSAKTRRGQRQVTEKMFEYL